MAETYDPNMLAAWGARDVAADVPRARVLYRSAFSLGVAAAEGRLQALQLEQASQANPIMVPRPIPATRCDGIQIVVANDRRCLQPKDSFRDCPTCPEMVIVPAGSFTMGSPSNEPGRYDDEDHVRVAIAAPFAAGKYAGSVEL